jgi:co-chaperonin GroES (HSP10)
VNLYPAFVGTWMPTLTGSVVAYESNPMSTATATKASNTKAGPYKPIFNLQPNLDFYHVLCDEAPEMSAGGIAWSDTAKDRAKIPIATILAVGSGRHEGGVLVPMNFKKGDRVLFIKYREKLVDPDRSKREAVLAQTDIFGKVEE